MQNENQNTGYTINDIDIKKQYLKEAAKYPRLTRVQEISLSKKISSGNTAQKMLDENKNQMSKAEIAKLINKINEGKQAKTKFVNSNLLLVVHYASEMLGNGLSYLDLIQEGNIGLMTAVDKYDPSKGAKFSTYATYWIKQSMMRGIQKKGRSIHLPIHLTEKIRKLKKAERELTQAFGKKPSIAQLSYELDIPESEVSELLNYSVSVDSLNVPISEDDNAERGDFVADKKVISSDERLDSNFIIDKLSTMLEDLNMQQRIVVTKRFGIGCEQSTLEEIAKDQGISVERVRQIISATLKKLNKSALANGLQDMWGNGQTIHEEDN